MRFSRRNFIKTGSLASGGLILNSFTNGKVFAKHLNPSKPPITVLTTWDFGIHSNAVTYKMMLDGHNSLDSIEQGIHIAEDDPENHSVGYGGYPDEKGIVTLDASVMDWIGNAGSVAALENIRHPISLAKLVMQKTDHVMLAGKGAKDFALENNFVEENLLTEEAKKWWLDKMNEFPNGEFRNHRYNHDTIGMLAIDKFNNMSGGVSSSGMGFKVRGRVGDSPIIGAALFVDNEFGGAVATGNGEYVMKTLGSFLIVEKMREGLTPQKACELAINRVYKCTKKHNNIQVGFLALNKFGEYGAYALNEKFSYSITNKNINEVVQSDFLIK